MGPLQCLIDVSLHVRSWTLGTTLSTAMVLELSEFHMRWFCEAFSLCHVLGQCITYQHCQNYYPTKTLYNKDGL